ncbi:MAG: modulator of FtsH protease HflC [Clostridiales bacterium]|jgi:membrane protease subunit HflC|nr:modulator of FtsH protease HflC [Clostridiales bacterium]MDN5298387.1 modulator of FtsH protease HflC [Clostridiales bacterium]
MNINQGEPRQDASQESFRDASQESSTNRTRQRTRRPTRNFSPGDYQKSIKNGLRGSIGLIIVIAILVVISNSIFIVREDEVATVREFGEIKSIIVDATNTQAQIQNDLDPRFKNVKVITQKGLHFKTPFITTVDKDTSKLLTYISNPAKINTKDKIKYEINMFAQWEIVHPGIFRTSLGSITKANSKIDEVAYAAVIEKINSVSSTQFLTDKEVLAGVLDDAIVELNANLATQGIMLRDIEIYRTILPVSNIESTYKKMIAEREAIAQQARSEGMEIYQNTVADTDRQVAEIKASAIEESETVKGEADATALEIYANGFSKDPEFYEFWRTLKSYETTIDEDTTLYMDRNNDYLKYFSN